jgi:hypothetical protein
MLCLKFLPWKDATPPPSKRFGSMATPMPRASDSMRMKALRRVACLVAMNMPETNTLAKHWSTRPPTTQMGIDVNAAPSFPNTPNNISQKAHEKPADRDAHCVSEMTPLFCENVVLGGLVKRQARNELTPSARSPPWTCVEIKFQAPHAIDVMLSP